LAAQTHELRLTRHYETLLHSHDSHDSSSDLVSSTNTNQALQRLSYNLRALLLSMAGENPNLSDPSSNTNFDPDYDQTNVVDLNELEQLIENLDQRGGYDGHEGRQDWVLEREYEIARLERENEALRKMMKIDGESIAATGVDLNSDRTESGPYSTYLPSSSRKGLIEDEMYGYRPTNWDISQQQQQQSQQMAGGAPLQRAVDLQPGMRMGTQGQARRTGIIGGGQQRGGLSGVRAGLAGIGLGAPGSPGHSSLWTNQSAPPSIDRSWQDFNR